MIKKVDPRNPRKIQIAAPKKAEGKYYRGGEMQYFISKPQVTEAHKWGRARL